jgi:hypothetical protein
MIVAKMHRDDEPAPAFTFHVTLAISRDLFSLETGALSETDDRAKWLASMDQEDRPELLERRRFDCLDHP